MSFLLGWDTVFESTDSEYQDRDSLIVDCRMLSNESQRSVAKLYPVEATRMQFFRYAFSLSSLPASYALFVHVPWLLMDGYQTQRRRNVKLTAQRTRFAMASVAVCGVCAFAHYVVGQHVHKVFNETLREFDSINWESQTLALAVERDVDGTRFSDAELAKRWDTLRNRANNAKRVARNRSRTFLPRSLRLKMDFAGGMSNEDKIGSDF